MEHRNTYTHNAYTGAPPNPLMPNPDEFDREFATQADEILSNGVELVRRLVGAHQAAIAIVINKDWNYVRKFFSLSEKYAAWGGYSAPAKGYGTHAWLLEHNKPVRFTHEELTQHPAWKNFGIEGDKHPPMRGWMAAPITDSKGVNWGLVQLSDKYEGDFTEEDEQHFLRFVTLVSQALESAWELRNLKQERAR
jgi:GAF domain-containing protein